VTLAERQERQARFLAAETYPARLHELLREILSPGGARNISVLGGRQSAKSHTCTAAALALALLVPGVNVIYVTSTYATVARMAFDPAKKMNLEFCLGGRPNGQRQSITFGNKSTVYFLGADNERTVDRLKGTPNLVAVFLDESGIWASDLLKQIIETVRPGLRPRAGKLVVLGNPSLTGPVGTWYDITCNAEYKQYRYTYRDNDKVPSFADTERLIDEDLRAQGVTRDSAYYRREYGGPDGPEFAVDLAERVYQVTEQNFTTKVPDRLDCYATGGDLGVSANDALVTIGWYDRANEVYVVEETLASGQDSLAFAAMANDVFQRLHPLTIVVDPGGLGQKTIRTVQSLFRDIPITEALKPPIPIQVRAVNQLLQTGRLKMRRDSKLAEELLRPTWENGIVGTKVDEHGKHSDLVPALRYVCLAVANMLPDLTTPETAEVEAKRLEREQKAANIAAAAKQYRLRTGKLNDDDIAESLETEPEWLGYDF
jgi:hypothetical protein